jgi:alkaline phosphatase D
MLGFKIGEAEDLADGRVVEGPALKAETSFTGQAEVTGLKPSTRYFYAPLLDGEASLGRPYPSFLTAPPSGSAGRLRVAFGSCVGPRGYAAAAAFGEMAERHNFDLLLMLGDNHYGDTTNPDLLRDHLFMHRKVSGFEQLIRQIPTYAIWDDHDFGPNNSDGTSPGKAESLAVFRQWWANPAYGEPDNPGCYYRFSHSIDFFMLDVRCYRRQAHRTLGQTMLDSGNSAADERPGESRAKFKIVVFPANGGGAAVLVILRA